MKHTSPSLYATAIDQHIMISDSTHDNQRILTADSALA